SCRARAGRRSPRADRRAAGGSRSEDRRTGPGCHSGARRAGYSVAAIMRVLVTGHHGYIGAVLAPLVASAGHEVVGLDTFYYRGCDFGPDAWQPARLLSADVRDADAGWLDGIDAVVHLAALSNDPIGDLNEEWTHQINGAASVDLAAAAKKAGVERYVF